MVGVHIYPKYPPKVDTAEGHTDYTLRIERQLQRYIFGDEFAGGGLNTPTSQEYERNPSEVPIDGYIDMVNLSHNVVSMIAREQLVLLNRIMANHLEGMDYETSKTFRKEMAILANYAKEEHQGLD